VVALQGRQHLYEGRSPVEVTFAVRVLARLGVKVLVLTTASGGIHRHMKPGDFMLIEDQVSLQMRSLSPAPPPPGGLLWAAGEPIYSPQLVARALEVAQRLGLSGIHRGVFCGMLGPTYETPAEVRMTARLGADAISMSVVLEAQAARSLGLEVLGISAIVNVAAGLKGGPLDHEEVLHGAQQMQGPFLAFLSALVPELAE
jgi:purine-nucleoside phosphorylase